VLNYKGNAWLVLGGVLAKIKLLRRSQVKQKLEASAHDFVIIAPWPWCRVV